MAPANETPWVDANIKMVEKYLKNEFENFSVAHRTDTALTHTFTVNDGKKRFTLFIEGAILADRTLTSAGSDRLLKANVAGAMRLHGDIGYHWTPPNEDPTGQGGN